MPAPPQLPPDRSGGHAPVAAGAPGSESVETATVARPGLVIRVFGRMTRAAAILTGVAIGASVALGVTAGVALSVDDGGSVPVESDSPPDAGDPGVSAPVAPPAGDDATAAAEPVVDEPAIREEPRLASESVPTVAGGPPAYPGSRAGARSLGESDSAEAPSRIVSTLEVVPTSESAALADLRQRNLHLPLPRMARGLGTVNRDPVELAKLPVDDPNSCELTLVGADVVFGRDQPVHLRPVALSDGTRQWNVEQVAANTVTGPVILGTFRVKDQALWFEWGRAAAPTNAADALPYCLLQVQAGGESELCLLTTPQTSMAAELNLATLNARTDVGLSVPDQALASQLRFEIIPQSFPSYSFVRSSQLVEGDSGSTSEPAGPSIGMGATDVAIIRFVPPADAGLDSGDNFVDLEIRFVEERGRVFLVTQPFVYRHEIQRDYSTLEQRRPFAFGEVTGASRDHQASRVRLLKLLQQTASETDRKVRDQERIQQVISSGSSSATAQLSLNQQLEIVASDVLSLQTRAQALEAAIDQTVRNDTILGEVKKLYTELEQNAAVGYRAYLLVHGRRVDMLDATARPGAPAPVPPLNLELK